MGKRGRPTSIDDRAEKKKKLVCDSALRLSAFLFPVIFFFSFYHPSPSSFSLSLSLTNSHSLTSLQASDDTTSPLLVLAPLQSASIYKLGVAHIRVPLRCLALSVCLSLSLSIYPSLIAYDFKPYSVSGRAMRRGQAGVLHQKAVTTTVEICPRFNWHKCYF